MAEVHHNGLLVYLQHGPKILQRNFIRWFVNFLLHYSPARPSTAG